MFVLRRITSEHNEVNTCIGRAYNLVRKVENKEAYERTIEAWMQGAKTEDEDIYGFIIHNNGQSIVPLYRKSTYFMMMSNGQTFANVSDR